MINKSVAESIESLLSNSGSIPGGVRDFNLYPGTGCVLIPMKPEWNIHTTKPFFYQLQGICLFFKCEEYQIRIVVWRIVKL